MVCIFVFGSYGFRANEVRERKEKTNLDLMQSPFLNNNLLHFWKTQFSIQNGVKQSLQQQRCLAGNSLRKTIAYNKNVFKMWKKAVFNTKWCKTDIATTNVFRREDIMQNTRLCLWWNRPPSYVKSSTFQMESPTLCGIAHLFMEWPTSVMWNGPLFVDMPAYGCGVAHIWNWPLLWYIYLSLDNVDCERMTSYLCYE